MFLNKSFAEILKQKMTIGSTRSILLNALPGRLATRLPLNDLDNIENGISQQFLNSLTSEATFTIRFAIDLNNKEDDILKSLLKTQKRLTALKYEHDDYLKEHGVETFGFGFPILLRKNIKDPTKFIAAPLFIFPLEIKESFDKTRQWIISRDNNSEIRVNEVFSSYLENEEHIKVPAIPEEILEDGNLDKLGIEAFCSSLLTKFEKTSEQKPHWLTLDQIPEKLSSSDPLIENTNILWNGVFGLYKSQKQSQIKEMEELLENYEETSERDSEFDWENSHSPMLTDPSQNFVLRSLKDNRDLVIQGPPGTGKSQTLSAVILSAIANNKKILVVCEKRTALEVLKRNLEKVIPEISSSIALVEDVSRDRAGIVEIVRNRTARYLNSIHLKLTLHNDIKRFEEKAGYVDQQYKSLRNPIWRNVKWKDLISTWIALRNTDEYVNGLYPLKRLFQSQNLDDTEYAVLLARVEDAAIIYKKVFPDYHYFESIIKTSSGISNDYYSELIYSLNETIQSLGRIKSELTEFKENYFILSEKENRNVILTCTQKIKDLIAIVGKWESENIDISNPSMFVKFKALFLKKYSHVFQDSKKAQELQNAIQSYWSEYFDNFRVADTNLAKVDFLNNEALNIFNQRTSLILKQRISEIGSVSFNKDKFNQLSNGLELLKLETYKFIKLNRVNEEHCSISDIEDGIQNTTEIVMDVLNKQHNLKDYFAWKVFESNLNEKERNWIYILLGKDTDQWVKLVRNAWLYFKLLEEDKNDVFPTDDSTIEVLKSLGLNIQINQKEIIRGNLSNWFLAGQNKIKQKGLLINQVYNLRGSKGSTRNSLRKIIQISLEAFTDFFPILMLNPGTCSSILPLKNGFFDIVIFDEASQLRIEDTFPSLLRGKQVIVSGDSQQMPPSSYFESSTQLIDDDTNEDDNLDEPVPEDQEQKLIEKMIIDNSKDMAMSESLLQFAIDSEFRQTYLDMHYRSRHPDLIRFSNACFYNNRLVPMPEKSNIPPIIFKRIDGLYDNRQNIDEAKEIVRILREELDDTLSVGVATFNLNQRNLILDHINDERSYDENFRAKMDGFEKNGFFVKNLENIQGDEKDIILISTTFGVKKDNSFRLGFGPISQKNGYRLLNVIITRAKHKLYVVTSIPDAKIQEYRQRLEINRKVDGTTGLLAYLAYAKAVSTNNQSEKQGILDYIRSKISIGQTTAKGDSINLTESPFEEEVATWLYDVIDKDRIQLQYQCGGFRIDMVVFPKNADSGIKLAIECDGAAYHSDQLAWHHDIYRQQQLEENGFIFHRIWSTNWWRKPEEEFQKLLETIEKIN